MYAPRLKALRIVRYSLAVVEDTVHEFFLSQTLDATPTF